MLDLLNGDLSWPYLIVAWLGAFIAILEIQKIAHGAIMTELHVVYRHLIRIVLGCLAAALMWSGYAPIKYDEPPWPSDLVLVGCITALLMVRAASGCSWAKKGGLNVRTARQSRLSTER